MKRGTVLKWIEHIEKHERRGTVLDYSQLGYVVPNKQAKKMFPSFSGLYGSNFERLFLKEVRMCPYGVLVDFLNKGKWDNRGRIDVDVSSLFSMVDSDESMSFPSRYKASCKAKRDELHDAVDEFDGLTIIEFMEENCGTWGDVIDFLSHEENYKLL